MLVHEIKKTSLILLLIFTQVSCTIFLHAQQIDNRTRAKNGLIVLTKEDSIFQASLPILKLPENHTRLVLPEFVDNSQLPYFRPIINQVSQECSQVGAVGYTFTYEINCLRNLAADIPENQYPTHFVFNWGNKGIGSAVSYFDSWDIISKAGTPNVADYGGGLNTGGDARWMSGYDNYYNAMQNRLWEFYSIPVTTEEGLLTLKHWINNHLEGSEHGGLANFYCSYEYPNQFLPQGTPEEGKLVITNFLDPADHSLCLVGFHDSIRFDYNNDGQYTNHIDINNDGEVDLRDWEIGGVKIANTHGTTWCNDGFSYVMYNALCRNLSQSGIWNGAVQVIDAKEQTLPQLTYKVQLTHNSRYKIKVMAGVASMANATEPEFIIDFPIFNYQGGDRYLQGGEEPEDRTLEFGLDVSALLNFIDSGSEATYFLLVDENDPGNIGTGTIDKWSVMDYTGDLLEHIYPQTNVPLIENQTTSLGLTATIQFDGPEIVNDSLPCATLYETYENQMMVNGGSEPYYWYLQQNYTHEYGMVEFPNINQQQLYPTNATSGYAEAEIDFGFPFYGKKYNRIFVHTDGYLMFEAGEYPWTFVLDEFNLFKNMLNISPFASRVLGVSDGGGMWYEGDETKATFRWKATEYGTLKVLNFAVSIYPSGKIEFHYGEVNLSPWNKWHGGIAEGDAFNYVLLGISNTFNLPVNTLVTFDPEFSFSEMQIDRDGLFHGTPTMPYDSVDISFYARDANGVSKLKMLPFSARAINDIAIKEVSVMAGTDDVIEFGESVVVSMILQNMTETVIDASEMMVTSGDAFVTMTDSTESPGVLQPGETMALNNAFAFDVSDDVPDNYLLVFDTEINSENDTYDNNFELIAYSVDLIFGEITIEDGNNGYPEPGETIQVYAELTNQGGAGANNANVLLQNSDTYFEIVEGSAVIDEIDGNSSAVVEFVVEINDATPIGHLSQFDISAEADFGFVASQEFTMLIGFVCEDFESGDFSEFDWGFSGNQPWTIDDSDPYEGQYCMQSGEIDHGQTSEIIINIEVPPTAEVSFWYQVSSEAGFDFLEFYIDDEKMDAWSGDVAWAKTSFEIEPGEKTFKWVYAKNDSGTGGDDFARVDYIIFPPSGDQTLAVDAGQDITTCENLSPELDGLVDNASSVLWTTAGDGEFSDHSIPNPNYTAGDTDIENGTVDLTLTAFGPSGNELSDQLTLSIALLPVVWAGEDATHCGNAAFGLSGTANYTDGVTWSTSGDGIFDDPASALTFYFPGAQDLTNGNVTLTLSGFSAAPCTDNISDELNLVIHPLPDVSFDTLAFLCENWPPHELTEGYPAGGEYSGPGVVDGWFYPDVAGTGTHMLTYTYTDENSCTSVAERSIDVNECSGLPGFDNKKLQLRPNPGTGIFHLSVDVPLNGIYLLKVFNFSGEMVLEKTFNFSGLASLKVDLTHQPEGLYYLMLAGEGERFGGKVVVVR